MTYGKVYGVHDAAELHQSTVAHELDHTPVVLGGFRLEKLFAMGVELRERSGFVGSHGAAITDNVGCQDGGQPALYTLFTHGTP